MALFGNSSGYINAGILQPVILPYQQRGGTGTSSSPYRTSSSTKEDKWSDKFEKMKTLRGTKIGLGVQLNALDMQERKLKEEAYGVIMNMSSSDSDISEALNRYMSGKAQIEAGRRSLLMFQDEYERQVDQYNKDREYVSTNADAPALSIDYGNIVTSHMGDYGVEDVISDQMRMASALFSQGQEGIIMTDKSGVVMSNRNALDYANNNVYINPEYGRDYKPLVRASTDKQYRDNLASEISKAGTITTKVIDDFYIQKGNQKIINPEILQGKGYAQVTTSGTSENIDTIVKNMFYKLSAEDKNRAVQNLISSGVGVEVGKEEGKRTVTYKELSRMIADQRAKAADEKLSDKEREESVKKGTEYAFLFNRGVQAQVLHDALMSAQGKATHSVIPDAVRDSDAWSESLKLNRAQTTLNTPWVVNTYDKTSDNIIAYNKNGIAIDYSGGDHGLYHATNIRPVLDMLENNGIFLENDEKVYPLSSLTNKFYTNGFVVNSADPNKHLKSIFNDGIIVDVGNQMMVAPDIKGGEFDGSTRNRLYVTVYVALSPKVARGEKTQQVTEGVSVDGEKVYINRGDGQRVSLNRLAKSGMAADVSKARQDRSPRLMKKVKGRDVIVSVLVPVANEHLMPGGAANFNTAAYQFQLEAAQNDLRRRINIDEYTKE